MEAHASRRSNSKHQLRFALAALSLLVPLSVDLPAVAAINADDDLAICRDLAAHVRVLASHPGTLGESFRSRKDILSPIVQFPSNDTEDQALAAEAMALFGEGSKGYTVHLQRIERSTWRSYQIQGTADCTYEEFFTVAKDGPLASMETPPAYNELCWSDTRDIGMVAGKPALVEIDAQEHPLLGEDVEITPWASGWQQTCRVSLRFTDTFSVKEQFCADAGVCRVAVSIAPKLAKSLARDPTGKSLVAVAPPHGSPANAEQLNRATKVLQHFKFDDEEPLPTFGERPKTRFPDFSYEGNHRALIYLNGRYFIARVGIGGVGWRQIGDYLVAVYAVTKGGMTPVASFVVGRQATGLESATVSVPAPYKNER